MAAIKKIPKIFHGWWIVLASLITTFAGIGSAAQAFTVILKYLYDEFGWSRASISGAKSLMTLVSAGMGPLYGRGIDLFDPRWVIIPGAAVMGFAFTLLSQTTTLWLLIIAFFLVHMSMVGIIIHFFSFFTDLGLSRERAATLFAVKSMIAIGAHFLIGRLADIFNRKYIAVLSYLFISMGCFLLFLMEIRGNLYMVYPFLLFYGLGQGGKTVMEFVLVAEIFGTKSMGTILGFIKPARTGGGALGPVLAGYLFDIYGGYRWTFLLFTFCCILGSILVAFTRPQQKRS